MSSYVKLVLEDHTNDQFVSHRINLFENFKIFLTDNPTVLNTLYDIVPYSHFIVDTKTFQLTKHGHKYPDDTQVQPMMMRAMKIPFRFAIEDVRLDNLDYIFSKVTDFLNNRNSKHFWFGNLIWSYAFHPFAFCPLPGLIIRFCEYKGDERELKI